MEHYRPEGWVKLEEHPCSGDGCLQCRDYANREAGADAMLEGLKKDAYAEIKNDYDPIYMFGIDETMELPKGHLVFIPEEK